MTLHLEEVLKATEGTLLQGEMNASFRSICTDSRTVEEGELFIALKGPRFDGHFYAIDALEKKAGGVLIEEKRVRDFRWNGYRSRAVIVVKDTLRALGDLARARRRRLGVPVVAVTGSNGKTTTKEMVSACLESAFPVLKTKGNLNNLIGLPLTLLNLTGKEKAVVVEMGMNVPGEVRRLTEISEPDVGLITNIQMVHLQGMGSLERIKQEKGELFRKMREEGTIVVNGDDPQVVDLARAFPGRKMTFGVEGPGDVVAKGIRLRGAEGTSFTAISGAQERRIVLPLLGRHFVPNALSAIAVATLFGITVDKAGEALEQIRPVPMRMELCPLEGGRTLINDAYNANPRSMEMALETLAEVKDGDRGIAVLGDMLELGNFSEEAHRKLGQRAGELSTDGLIALGEMASIVVGSALQHGLSPERAWVVKSHLEAISILKKLTQPGDWILVKGSRAMAMERIAEGLVGPSEDEGGKI